MKYTLAIDVPSLEEMTQDPYKVELLECCISAVGRLKDSVLTMTEETAMEVFYTNVEMCSMLSNVTLDIYDDGIRIHQIPKSRQGRYFALSRRS